MTTKTEKLSSDFWIGLLAPVLISVAALIVFPVAVLRAWVLAILWGWYIVPAFDVSPLRIIYAFGISLIVTYLTRPPKARQKDSNVSAPGFWESLLIGCCDSLMALFLGWIGTLFI